MCCSKEMKKEALPRSRMPLYIPYTYTRCNKNKVHYILGSVLKISGDEDAPLHAVSSSTRGTERLCNDSKIGTGKPQGECIGETNRTVK
jgi:hypothetical protein